MLHLMTTFIIGVAAVINLIRMMAYLVGADLYTIRRARSKAGFFLLSPVGLPRGAGAQRGTDRRADPGTPAEGGLRAAADHRGGRRVDRRHRRADHRLKLAHDRGGILEAFTKTNGGKADALNTAIRTRATGELVMCLDGDSILAPDAVEKSVAYFPTSASWRRASNVNIMPDGTLLGLVQRYEYLISYHMKKAQNRVQRRVHHRRDRVDVPPQHVLDEVGLYDTNTMTEDIDLTLKIIAQKGNTNQRVAYAARRDHLHRGGAIVPVTVSTAVPLEVRPAAGLLQALAAVLLPGAQARWPVVVHAALCAVAGGHVPDRAADRHGRPRGGVYYRSPWTLISAMVIISCYVIANILSTVHLSRRRQGTAVPHLTAMYMFLYLLSVVEYIALIQTMVKLPSCARPSAVKGDLELTGARRSAEGRSASAGGGMTFEDYRQMSDYIRAHGPLPTGKEVRVGSRVILSGKPTA